MIGRVGWSMILSVSISSPEKQKENRGFGSEVGSASGGGLRKVNVNLQSLFLFDSDVRVNDRPVQLAHLAAYVIPPTSTWITYGHNEVSSFNFIAYDGFSDLFHFLDFNGGALGGLLSP